MKRTSEKKRRPRSARRARTAAPRGRGPLRRLMKVGLRVSLAAGLAAAAGIWAAPRVKRMVRQSPLFIVDSVSVSHACFADTQEVIARSRLRAGMHMLDVNPGEASERVESLPWVRKARVMRRLPDKVRIVVEERRPRAMVSRGAVWYVDEEGVLLPLSPRTSVDLPLVFGLRDTLAGEDDRRLDSASLWMLNGFLDELAGVDEDFVGEISQIAFGDGVQVHITLEERGTRVSMRHGGACERIEHLRRLLTLFNEREDDWPREIDLCHANLAFVH